MTAFIIAIHVLVCVLLIIIILIQAGRGGGLVEGFSGVESMFGAKTNALLTRATSVLATIFFITCVTLALSSAHSSRSLMRNARSTGNSVVPQAVVNQTEAAPAPVNATGTQDATPQKP